MKHFIFRTGFFLLAMHVSVTFSEAATSLNSPVVDTGSNLLFEVLPATQESNLLSEELAFLEDTAFSAAPTLRTTGISKPVYKQKDHSQLTQWEIMHRSPVFAGFVWTGVVAQFLYQQPYENFPENPYENDAYSYDECVKIEVETSFGVFAAPLSSDVFDELKGIAKYCAQEFYGPYFEGKSYTTREEMLMMFFTLFDEGIELMGEFDETGKYYADPRYFTFSGYKNVSPTAWYAPYIKHARLLDMLDDGNVWKVAQEVSNSDIFTYFEMYSIYRMEYTGDEPIKNTIIYTNSARYDINFFDDGFITFKQNA